MRKIFLSALCCLSLVAAAKQINPLTQAMLDGYNTLLQENPEDYLTLYERASQYYRLDEYDNALSDIKKAINFTPDKEKAQLASEYELLSDIYIQTEQYPEAMMAVEQALTLSPSSYRLLYMQGNVALHLKQSDKARSAFNAMRAVNPRSAEAIFGLARVAAMEGKKDEAIRLIADAEKMDPGNYLTFCRKGDVHKELGMLQDAAADYLSAFSLSSDSDRPMSSIIALAKDNYDAVDEAIDFALQKTRNVVPLYFIQGNAALNAGRYNDAYNAYRELLSSVSDDDAKGLYADVADICLHRGELEEADNYASKAMIYNSDVRNNLLKAKIETIRGNHQSAKMYAQYAYSLEPDNHEVLMQAAQSAYSMNDIDSALAFLSQIVTADADAVDALMLRGYIYANEKKDKQAALADYTRAARVKAVEPADVTLKAIAQMKAGQSLDASATIASIYTAAEKDAKSAYLAALYNRACGKDEDAQKMIDKAIALGFDDQYLLKYYSMPLLSINKK